MLLLFSICLNSWHKRILEVFFLLLFFVWAKVAAAFTLLLHLKPQSLWIKKKEQ